MTPSRTIKSMEDSLESNLISTKQKLDSLLDKYGEYLPKEVFFTIYDSITDLQMLDSQLVELFKYTNKLKDE